MTSNTAIEASDKKRKKVILEEERVEYWYHHMRYWDINHLHGTN